MLGAMSSAWRHCSRCKAPIPFGGTYWTCNVSTCNRVRAPMVFCGMDCWDSHLPIARHREAWAEEQRAPSSAEAAAANTSSDSAKASASSSPLRRSEGSSTPDQSAGVRRRVDVKPRRDPSLPIDVLIVASKLKAYIKAASDMNTSASVMDVLSDKVRDLCDAAIANAKAAGRQTVMDRDFR